MNAVVRKKHGGLMLTNEVIETHLASLRAGQEDLREDVRELRADNKSIRDKIDAVDTKLTQEIRAVEKKLDEKIDEKFSTLDAKIDKTFGTLDAKIDKTFGTLDAKIDAINANLNEKIMQLSNAVAGLAGMQKATIWLIGIFGSLGTVGKILHWF